MQPQFIEELLRLFFNSCSNNPKVFVAIFDHSNTIIGFNFRSNEHRFTDVSASFKHILGYNLNNILDNGNFTEKIVHPQDKHVIDDCLKKTIPATSLSLQNFPELPFNRVKCRARHIRDYWKYFIVYALDYYNDFDQTTDKIGLIVDERIGNHQEKSKHENEEDNDDTFWKYQNSTRPFSDSNAEHISPRESEILELISRGMVTKEIAVKLHISDSTVVTHRKNLISKLNVRNTAELIKKAARYMLIS